MSHHSPGPWAISEDGISVYSVPCSEIVDVEMDGRTIQHNRGMVALPYGHQGGGTRAREANTRLIAAAPEMYAMLRRLSAAIAPTREGRRDGGTFGALSSADDEARALLAEIDGAA